MESIIFMLFDAKRLLGAALLWLSQFFFWRILLLQVYRNAICKYRDQRNLETSPLTNWQAAEENITRRGLVGICARGCWFKTPPARGKTSLRTLMNE